VEPGVESRNSKVGKLKKGPAYLHRPASPSSQGAGLSKLDFSGRIAQNLDRWPPKHLAISFGPTSRPVFENSISSQLVKLALSR
jgi:hypothetical protein